MTDLVCFLDLDGVLVDFVSGALKLHDKTIPMKDVKWGFPSQIGFTGVDDPLFWKDMGFAFWAGLEWTHEGKELLAGLEAIFKDRIAICTSPCGTPGGVEGKVAWIKREIPEYRRRFFVGPSKHLCAAKSKILVDDHAPNIMNFIENKGDGVLVPRPWNNLKYLTDEEGRFDVEKLLDTVKLHVS